MKLIIVIIGMIVFIGTGCTSDHSDIYNNQDKSVSTFDTMTPYERAEYEDSVEDDYYPDHNPSWGPY